MRWAADKSLLSPHLNLSHLPLCMLLAVRVHFTQRYALSSWMGTQRWPWSEPRSMILRVVLINMSPRVARPLARALALIMAADTLGLFSSLHTLAVTWAMR